MTKRAFLREVGRRLPPPRPNLKLTIVDDGVQKDADRWCVPIQAEGSLGVDVNALSVLKQRLYEDLKLNVLTIPTA